MLPNNVPLAERIAVNVDSRIILALDEALNPSKAFVPFNLHLQLRACANSLVCVCSLRRRMARFHTPCAIVAACDLDTIQNCVNAVGSIAPATLQSCGRHGISVLMHARHVLAVQAALNVRFESSTAFVMFMACTAMCSMKPKITQENFVRAFRYLRDVHPELTKISRNLAQAIQWPWQGE